MPRPTTPLAVRLGASLAAHAVLVTWILALFSAGPGGSAPLVWPPSDARPIPAPRTPAPEYAPTTAGLPSITSPEEHRL